MWARRHLPSAHAVAPRTPWRRTGSSPTGERTGDRRIPMIHSAPKMLHEKKRRAALLSEPAVGEANTVGFNELRGGRDVFVCHRSSCSALARTNPECPRIGSVAWTEMRNRLVSSRRFLRKIGYQYSVRGIIHVA